MKPFLLITDLDNTLVGDALALAKLNHQLESHRRQYGTRIVYSTGRSLPLYRELTQTQTLLEPDILICAVGTEIYQRGQADPDVAWSEKLSHGWNREQVVAIAAHFADLVPQPFEAQCPFKVSYHIPTAAALEVIPRLESLLRQSQLDIQIIFSGGIDLDILPRGANKGMAMTFVRQMLAVDPLDTVACGDSGNDIALFADRPERGIVVGNALPELLEWHQQHPNPQRYLATAHCAAGILEGLGHFQFLEV